MSNSSKYIPLIRRLKKLGYMVFVVYMDVPKEVSVERAMNRYVSNKGGKTKYGRYVPMSVIEDFFRTGKQGYEEIKKSVDGYILVDSLTQKIVERGGMEIPADREYSGVFKQSEGVEYELSPNVSAGILQSRLKLLNKMIAKKSSATLKTRIKIVEKMIAVGGKPAFTQEEKKEILEEVEI